MSCKSYYLISTKDLGSFCEGRAISHLWLSVCSAQCHASYILQVVPVEHVVVGEALPVEQVPDELAQVGVVWLLLKPQRSHIVLVRGELGCGTTSQIFRTD